MDSENFLLDQVCIVTGSSRGIGREIALTLARHGADVVINFRRDDKSAHELSARIEALGRKTLTVQADVSTTGGAENLIDSACGRFGRIDVLVNNAGLFSMNSIAETSIEAWHALLDANLNGGFYCTKYALPVMRAQGGGHFIFLGSTKADSTRARQNACAYGIAKTGVVILAKTLAREEGSNGIRANVVNPGIIVTGDAPTAEQEEYSRQTAMRKPGVPADIAGAVLFLLSPQGRYCNGSVIDVDGGLWL